MSKLTYPILASHQCTFDTNIDFLLHTQKPFGFLRLDLSGSILSLRYPLKYIKKHIQIHILYIANCVII